MAGRRCPTGGERASLTNEDSQNVPFEDVVAALLQVDPAGITGQRAKRRDDENDETKKAPPPE